MSRSGQITDIGGCHIAVVGGTPSIIPGSNSGMFTTVDDNGPGDYTLNVQSGFEYSPRAHPKVDVFGPQAAIVRQVLVPDGSSIQLICIDHAGAPVDLDGGGLKVTVADTFIG